MKSVRPLTLAESQGTKHIHAIQAHAISESIHFLFYWGKALFRKLAPWEKEISGEDGKGVGLVFLIDETPPFNSEGNEVLAPSKTDLSKHDANNKWKELF